MGNAAVSTLWPALLAPWRWRTLLALHLGVNTLLALLVYLWLWIPDERHWQLLVSFLLGVGVAGAALCFHAATLRFFGEPGRPEGFASVLRSSWRRVFPVAVCLAVALAAAWLAGWAQGLVSAAGIRASSWLTYVLNRPVAPSAVEAIFSWLYWLALWLAFIVLLLPAASAAASDGWAGLRAKALTGRWRASWSLRYLAAAAVLFLVGAVLPYALFFGWIPQVSGFLAETASLALRLGLAWLLANAAWLGLAWLLGSAGGRPATGGLVHEA
jgi:hypothetical protein